MNILRNVLALVGLLAIVVAVWAAIKIQPYYSAFQGFDDKAMVTYQAMATKLIESGNAAEATVWKQKVNEDLSIGDVEDVMKSVIALLTPADSEPPKKTDCRHDPPIG